MDKLIVVDMQNDFIDGILVNPYAQNIVPGVCDAIRKFNGEVFLTKDVHHKFFYDDTIEGQSLPLHCEDETEGAELHSDIKQAYDDWRAEHPHNNHFIYYKNTFAPGGDFFEPHEVANEDTIYICGICTDICVISTALKIRSEYPNNRIVCYANLCAGTDPIQHNRALSVMRSCLIEVTNYEMAD